MFRIIDRYLLRELWVSLLGVMSILMLVTFGGVMITVMDRIARGKLPATLLFSQLGLRSLDALTLTLPLGAFIAVMLAYGRLYRDSEMAVLSASGLPPSGLLRPVLWVGAILSSLLAALCLWLNPWALKVSWQMVDEANRSLLVAGFDAGRFVELPGGGGVIYVADMNAQGTEFKKMFAYNERQLKAGATRVDIITAKDGALFQDRQGSERYLSVREGFRVEGDLQSPEFRVMQFKRNDIRLPDPESQAGKRPEERIGTMQLWQRRTSKDWAELQWRLSVPVSVMVLMLFALPLAKSRPREPRFGKVLIAVFAYMIYSNLLSYMRGLIALDKLPHWAGLWWIHLMAIVVALFLLWLGDRLPQRKRA